MPSADVGAAPVTIPKWLTTFGAWVDEIEPDTLEFSILTPYPGCENYEKAKKEGYVNDNMDWSKVDLFSSDCALMGTLYLSEEEIRKEHERLSEKYKVYRRI